MVKQIISSQKRKEATAIEPERVSRVVPLDYYHPVPFRVVSPLALHMSQGPPKVVPVLRMRVEDGDVTLRVEAVGEVDFGEPNGKFGAIETMELVKDPFLHHERVVEGKCCGAGGRYIGVESVKSWERAPGDVGRPHHVGSTKVVDHRRRDGDPIRAVQRLREEADGVLCQDVVIVQEEEKLAAGGGGSGVPRAREEAPVVVSYKIDIWEPRRECIAHRSIRRVVNDDHLGLSVVAVADRVKAPSELVDPVPGRDHDGHAGL